MGGHLDTDTDSDTGGIRQCVLFVYSMCIVQDRDRVTDRCNGMEGKTYERENRMTLNNETRRGTQ